MVVNKIYFLTYSLLLLSLSKTSILFNLLKGYYYYGISKYICPGYSILRTVYILLWEKDIRLVSVNAWSEDVSSTKCSAILAKILQPFSKLSNAENRS